MSIVRGLQSIREEQGIDLWALKDAVEENLLGDMNDPKEKQKFSFAPSVVGYGYGRCPRYWYYAFKGATFINDNTPKSVANMKSGQDRHEYFAKCFDGAKGVKIIDVEKNIEEKSPPIFAYVDIIIEFQGQRLVGEFKTANSKSWYSVLKHKQPKKHHLIQLLTYMHFEQERYGFMMYENKDSNEWLFLLVDYEEYREKFDKVLRWMRKTHKALTKDGVVPERPWVQNSSGCRFCPVKSVCWEDEDGKTKLKTLSF